MCRGDDTRIQQRRRGGEAQLQVASAPELQTEGPQDWLYRVCVASLTRPRIELAKAIGLNAAA